MSGIASGLGKSLGAVSAASAGTPLPGVDMAALKEYAAVEDASILGQGNLSMINGKVTAWNNQDVTGLYNRFMDYAQRTSKTRAEHDAYVARTQEQPGRKATLLVPYSAPEAKTLLGGVNMAPKTLLGG